MPGPLDAEKSPARRVRFGLCADQPLFGEVFQYLNSRLLRRGRGGVDGQFRAQRLFIWVIDAGEILELAGTRLLVKALRIALFASRDRRVKKNLDEGQFFRGMQRSDRVAIFAIGANETGHRDRAAVGEEPGDFTDAANVLLTVGGRKTQILVESVANIVSVQDVGELP